MRKNYIYTFQVEFYESGKKVSEYQGTHDTEAEAKARLREVGGYARNAAARIYKSELGDYSRSAESFVIYEKNAIVAG